MVEPVPIGVQDDRAGCTSRDGQPDEAAFLAALGRRVRFLRLSRERTQDELAQATGMSRSFVSLIEHGAHGVDVVRLLRIAAAFGMPLIELIDVPGAGCKTASGDGRWNPRATGDGHDARR